MSTMLYKIGASAGEKGEPYVLTCGVVEVDGQSFDWITVEDATDAKKAGWSLKAEKPKAKKKKAK